MRQYETFFNLVSLNSGMNCKLYQSTDRFFSICSEVHFFQSFQFWLCRHHLYLAELNLPTLFYLRQNFLIVFYEMGSNHVHNNLYNYRKSKTSKEPCFPWAFIWKPDSYFFIELLWCKFGSHHILLEIFCVAITFILGSRRVDKLTRLNFAFVRVLNSFDFICP